MFWRRTKTREQELDRELRSHLESEAAERQESGMPPEEARFAARRAFGNTTLVKEEVREMWGWTAIEQIWQDLRFAARTLRKSPGFTTATVLTLAVGISANSAIFSIVNGVLLKPLPFQHPDQLVEVFARDAQGHRQPVSQPDLDDWRTMTHSFNGMASWTGQSVNLTGLEQPQRVIGMFVSSNFLPVLGVAPAIGRGFTSGEDRIGGQRVVLLSDALWHSRFGADPHVLGKTVDLNGEPYTIVGVLPPSFVFPPMSPDVVLPAFKYPNYSMIRGQTSCVAIARLRKDVSIQKAQAEMNAVAARLAATYPASNKGQGAMVLSFKEDVVADLKPSLTALAGAVAFVLLMACTNVASLLIARMVARERERAVRIALGASRSRLISHVVAETLLMAGTGGGLGLLFGIWSVPTIASSIAAYLPYGAKIELDTAVVVFTLGISLASAFLVAGIPAWQSSRVESLRTRSEGSGATRNRTRSILVVGEIALALVLLVGAGLMIKSFSELGRVKPGFDPHNLLTLAYRVPRNKYPSGAQQAQFHQEVVSKIKALPGVLAATSVRAVPLGGNGNSSEFFLADRPEPPVSQRPQALLNFADPNFFPAMRIPLLKGRVFNEHDQADGPYVIVINQTLARQYFNGRDPIGQRLALPQIQRTGEIVGVVGDVKQYTLTDPPAPQIYGALAQNPFIFTSLAVRTAGDPLRMATQIRRAIWQVDKDQPVWSVHSFDEILATQSHLRQLITAMMGAYAGVALVLASIGIFGVISYSVSQRTAEIGVRMALGARPADVARLVLQRVFLLTTMGIMIGAGAAMWLSRYLRTQLYVVSPLDPGVYAAVAALLAAVAILACLIPARRATKVDPMIALRYE
ncbi:MAG TPA: ABC transporter permease [Bryobacteraceae bacterium]